jgi:hypothetical protein
MLAQNSLHQGNRVLTDTIAYLNTQISPIQPQFNPPIFPHTRTGHSRSTATESELLSLSLAASQMEEWIRFFAGINLTLDCTPTIWCDNQQTVGIVTKQHDRLHTKVKHVDIHQLWIRQEVTASRINVQWVPTDRMPADGLTKILPKQKFVEFIRQLGLVDITERLKSLHQVNMDNLDSLSNTNQLSSTLRL